ncbi:MAG TPA: DMT family transporter [Gammaproteobacteria bacterium]|nr:DMT family transporter [Gammaproteobacteria bacterium]
MSLPAAYAGVILIWSTTPLAVKWSCEGPGYLFGVTSRMVIGVALCLLILALLRRRLPLGRRALLGYGMASISIYGALLCVYWGARFIPSGWVSVLFGLTPLCTSVLAAWCLGERALTGPKAGGMLLGLAGLVLIFGDSLNLGAEGLEGVAAVLLAVVLSAVSAVGTKKYGGHLDPVPLTAGTVLVSTLLFVLTWALAGAPGPVAMPEKAAWSIVYLGVFGSVLGFLLYFYALQQSSASQVSLILFVTPVLALFLGHYLNREPVSVAVALGTALIVAGLILHQWGGILLMRFRRW